MDKCDCCGEEKPDVHTHYYEPDWSRVKVPAGHKRHEKWGIALCGECFNSSHVQGTRAEKWLWGKLHFQQEPKSS
jgi:hypothetical protein